MNMHYDIGFNKRLIPEMETYNRADIWAEITGVSFLFKRFFHDGDADF